MTPKLNKEISDALHASEKDEVQAIDPATNKVYVVVDGEVHRQAMEALHRQKDHDAITEGIAQMEAGEGKSLDEAFEGIRDKLGFPGQQ